MRKQVYIWDKAEKVKITTLEEFHCFLLAFIYIAVGAVLGLGDVTFSIRSASILCASFVLSNQAINFTWGQ